MKMLLVDPCCGQEPSTIILFETIMVKQCMTFDELMSITKHILDNNVVKIVASDSRGTPSGIFNSHVRFTTPITMDTSTDRLIRDIVTEHRIEQLKKKKKKQSFWQRLFWWKKNA